MSDPLWSKTELKKCGLRQSRDGVVISFVLHPSDITPALVNAPIGTVYLAALVEKVEDGQPKEEKVETQAVEKPKKLNLTTQAAICCNEESFKRFIDSAKAGELSRQAGEEIVPSEVMSMAEAVRLLCDVESRADFAKDEAAGERWRRLHAEYSDWRLKE